MRKSPNSVKMGVGYVSYSNSSSENSSSDNEKVQTIISSHFSVDPFVDPFVDPVGGIL